MKKQTIWNKYLLALVIAFAFILIPGISPRAETIEENGFIYSDETKTKIIAIPNVESLIIPEGVEALNADAYAEWDEGEIYEYVGGEKTIFDKVKCIYLPNSLTRISEYYLDPEVFPNLQEIHIAEGNKAFSIKDGVLYSLSPLVQGKEYRVMRAFPNMAKGDIVMPSTVVCAEIYAFAGCNNIISLTFSKSFRYVHEYLEYSDGNSFDWNGYSDGQYAPSKINLGICENVEAYYVEAGNKRYQSVDGCLYSADGAELYMVPDKYNGKLTIPVGTMRVSDGAFANCTKMTAIKIPYGLTDLDTFSNCDSLKKVVIPSSVEYGVFFEDCDNLETIKLKWKHPFEKSYYKKHQIVKNCPNLEAIYVPKGTKKNYQSRIKEETKEFLKVGNYKPQTKKTKKLDKPKAIVSGSESWVDGEVYIAWKQVLYATDYKVQIKINRKWKTLKVDNKNQINYANPDRYKDLPLYFFAKDIGMKDGSIHYLRVVAYRGSVKSISKPQKVCIIDKPKIASAIAKKNGTVVVKWKKKNVTGYRIRVLNKEDWSSNYFTVKGAAKTRKIIKGLEKGVKYRIYVSAYRNSGKKEWISKDSKSANVVVK